MSIPLPEAPMKTAHIGVVLLGIQIVFVSGCREKSSGLRPDSKTDGVPVYLSHRDYGCEQSLTLDKIRLIGDGITESAWKSDTLSFTIRFGYICCAAFDDSISAENGRIEISSRDIASNHCRCMWVYYKDFAFLHPAKTPVRIVFTIKPWPPSAGETRVDTLLQMP
jgi:hypothetical protein